MRVVTPENGSVVRSHQRVRPREREIVSVFSKADPFFATNSVTEADKKKEILLAMVGPATFRLLTNLVVPAEPGDKTYKELVEALKAHHNPELAKVV